MKLTELLGIRHGVTALIGGGGKTTLLYHLAEELRTEGTVLVCTTTRMWPPDHLPVVRSAAELREALDTCGVACAGTPAEQGKLAEPSFDWMDRADYVLVEADGAAGRPFKAHEKWEPVLPERRNTSILVMGADGFGKPISKAAHRPGLYARLAGTTESRPLTPAVAAKVAEREGFHDQIFLNQVDREEEWPLARELAACVGCPVTAGSLRTGVWKRIQ